MVWSREKLASAKPQTCGRHLSIYTCAVSHRVTSVALEESTRNRTGGTCLPNRPSAEY